MTPEDHLRLVGELVSVFGAVIILLIEVWRGRDLGVRLSAAGTQPEPQSTGPLCLPGLSPDSRHLPRGGHSLLWTDHPWRTVPRPLVSLLPLTPVPFLTKAPVLLPGSLTSGEPQIQRPLSDVCVTLCVELTEVEPECVGTIAITPLLLDPQDHPSLPLITPSLLSHQHDLCLHGAGDHGDEAHQHQRGGGAHVLRPGAGLVQRHVLCARIPDAGSLHRHDPEGPCHLPSFLEKGPRAGAANISVKGQITEVSGLESHI